MVRGSCCVMERGPIAVAIFVVLVPSSMLTFGRVLPSMQGPVDTLGGTPLGPLWESGS